MTVHPQIIVSPCGDKMVVLPMDAYERMRDLHGDFHDGVEAQEIKRKIVSGEEETIPSDVVDKLLEGPDSKLKVWREYRGFTLQTLAKAANCSPVYISEIESGRKDGSIKRMRALSMALQVDLDDLV